MSEQPTPTPPSTPDSRSRYIEIIQLLSIFAIPATAAFVYADMPIAAGLCLVVVFAGFAIPFSLVKKPAEPVRHAFEITETRLATYEEIKIPADVCHAMRKAMLNTGYRSEQELAESVYSLVGEKRALPHIHNIIEHARVFVPDEDDKGPASRELR